MPARISQSSPLQRRIARHASLATIFRQPTAPAVTSQKQAERLSEPASSPIKARLLPSDSQLPEAILLPRLPLEGEAPAAWEGETLAASPPPGPGKAALQTAPDSRAAPATRPGPAPTQIEKTGQQASQVEPALPVSSDSVAGPDDEDRNWRRLQTIFHRHQERQQAEQAGEPAASQPEPASKLEAEGRIQTSIAEPASPTEAAGTENAPTQAAPAPESPAEPGPIQPQPEREQPQTAKPSSSEPSAAAGKPAPDEIQAVKNTGPVKTTGPSETAGPPAPEVPRPEGKLPLEDVWPVQRASQAAPASQPQAESPATGQEAPAQEAAPDGGTSPAPGEDQTQVESYPHLQTVRTGQPSSSPVEVIPPRRPHPMRPAAPGPEPQPEKPSQLPAPDQAGQIQTQKEPSKPELTQPESGPETSLPAFPESGPEQFQPAPERQVQTEIGPLPEDLWRLLGEEPPRAEEDTAPVPAVEALPKTAPKAAQADAIPGLGHPSPGLPSPGLPSPGMPAKPKDQPTGQPAAIQRAIAAAESQPDQASPHQPAGTGGKPAQEPQTPAATHKDVLPPIQRLESPRTSAPTESAAAAGSDKAETTESELDLDELARQVYSQVRRRLDLEFERLHRRK